MIELTKERWGYLKSQSYYEKDVKKLLEFLPMMPEHEVVKFWNWYAQSKCMTWADVPDSLFEIHNILRKYSAWLEKEIEKEIEFIKNENN